MNAENQSPTLVKKVSVVQIAIGVICLAYGVLAVVTVDNLHIPMVTGIIIFGILLIALGILLRKMVYLYWIINFICILILFLSLTVLQVNSMIEMLSSQPFKQVMSNNAFQYIFTESVMLIWVIFVYKCRKHYSK